MRFVYVTHFTPSDVGHGGNHRAYQIKHDLERTVGKAGVTVLCLRRRLVQDYRSLKSYAGMGKLLRRLGFSLAYRLENPFRFVARTRFSPRRYAVPGFLRSYEDLVQGSARPDVCIVEHTGFADIVSINQRYRIPTVICPQNLESLDSARPSPDDLWYMRAILYDLANELDVLRSCQERLFISKVEAGFVGGLGLPSRYYPYRPVGALAERLLEIRERRRVHRQEHGLFLLLGSAGHKSTAEAFRQFIGWASEHGLPANVQVIVAGPKTDTLLPPGEEVPGLELYGWVEQDVLDEWLVKAQAVLAPKQRGFGALTRLSELSCAGIPVIASRHPTYATDPPPGMWIAQDNWSCWLQAMTELAGGCMVSLQDYQAWFESQPATLEALIAGEFGVSLEDTYALPNPE